MSRLLRLFVSSTFDDMHAERDWLVRFGVPELRRRCRERDGDLVVVDLRWGIRAKDLRDRSAIEICLAEIDRCDLFLAVVGHRYGWVPLPTAVPPPVFRRAHGAATADEREGLELCYALDETALDPGYVLRDGLPEDIDPALVAACNRALRRGGHPDAGRSVTEQEVRHALARGVRGVVTLRERPLEVPSWMPSRLACAVSEPQQRAALDAFRRWLARQPGVLRYSATVGGIRLDPALAAAPDVGPLRTDALITETAYRALEPGVRDTVDRFGVLALDGLDTWGDAVVEAVWEHIEALLDQPDEGQDTPSGRFVLAQRRFAVGHADRVAGRAALLDELCAATLEGRRKPILLTGPEGSGKSAVLAAVFAKAAAAAAERGCAVVAHFVGAGRGSTDPAGMVAFLGAQLARACGWSRADLPRDRAELVVSLPSLLAAAARVRPVVVVLDGVDQLERPGVELPELTWLPAELPPGCGVLLSARPGGTVDALERHLGPAWWLPELDPSVRRALVVDALRRHGKQLTDNQLDRLLDTDTRPAAALPLFLAVAAEELSLFGSHQLLDARLDRLPAGTAALITQILARLEADVGHDLCALALPCVALGRGGIREREVLGVLERSTSTPQLFWSRLTASLAPFLDAHPGSAGEDRLSFSHDAFLRAVTDRYPAATVHGLLADQFAAVTDDPEALSELVHHLVRAGRTGAARQRLEDLGFLEAKTRALGVEALLADFAELGATGATTVLAAALTRQAEHLATGDGGTAPHGFLAQQLLLDAREVADPTLGALAASALTGPLFDLVWRVGGAQPGLRRTLVAPGFGTRHTSWVGSVGITDDGDIVAAGGSDGVVRVFSAATGRLLRSLPVSRAPVVAVSPVRGRTQLLVTTDEGAELWDYELGQRISALDGRNRTVRAAAIATDGRWAATAGVRRPIDTWDLTSAPPRVLRRLRPRVGPRPWWVALRTAVRLRFANARRRLVARVSGRVRVTVDPHRAAWTAVVVGDRLVAAGSADGLVQVWDRVSGRRKGRLLATDGGVTALSFGTTDDLVASAWTDRTIRVWNLRTRAISVLGDHDGDIAGILADRDGKTLYSCAKDGTVQRWDLPRGRATGVVHAHDDQVLAMAAAADGRTVVTGAGDGTVRLWTTAEMFDGPDVARDGPLTYGFAALAASAAASRVIAARAHSLHVWDLGSGTHLTTLDHDGSWLAAAALSADGRRVTAADDEGRLVRRDLVGGAVTASCDLGVRVESLAASLDGSLVVVGAADGTVWTWRPDSGDPPEALRDAVVGSARRVGVLADGRTVVVSDDSSAVLVWEAVRGDGPRGLGRHDAWVTAIAPLGQGFVTGSMDGSLRVWDPQVARPPRVLRGHAQAVRAIAVVSARYCLSASDDRTLRLWDTTALREVARVGLPTRPETLAVAPLHPTAPHVVVGDPGAVLRGLRMELGRS